MSELKKFWSPLKGRWVKPEVREAVVELVDYGIMRVGMPRKRRLGLVGLAREVVLQAARERVPGATPRIISDNGPQFIVKDFKEFIRSCTMTHVRTSPVYPQSNGKLERLTKSLKGECVRPTSPVSLSDARGLVATYVEHYNTVRLHSAIGYVTPQAKLEGRERAIFAERQRPLAQTRAARLMAYRTQQEGRAA
jgi:putative transposase